jgi:hypothetical protein
MNEIQHLLQRQGAWQKKRADLPWPDKIRMVEAILGSLRQLRDLKTAGNDRRQRSGREQQAELQERLTE